MRLLEAVDLSASQEEAIPAQVAGTILDNLFKGLDETALASGLSYSRLLSSPVHEPYNSVININAPCISYPGLLSPWKLHLKLLPKALPLYHTLKHNNIHAALRERACKFYPKQSNPRQEGMYRL